VLPSLQVYEVGAGLPPQMEVLAVVDGVVVAVVVSAATSAVVVSVIVL